MTDLASLRAQVQSRLGAKRFAHTLAVETECEALAQIFGLSDADSRRLRIAALLHDITKEKTPDEQIALCKEFHISYTACDLAAPKVFHAMTGACIAKADFPEWVDKSICQAIERHTVGHPEMELLDSLLYLADYIEETRTFPDCVKLRAFFYDGIHAGVPPFVHLRKTLILSFDMTISVLMQQGAVIAPDTFATRNALLLQQERQCR